jgi:hypothetical protein
VLRTAPGTSVWQPNDYDPILRNKPALHAIRRYIRSNPAKWALDRDHRRNTLRLPPPQAVEDHLADIPAA